MPTRLPRRTGDTVLMLRSAPLSMTWPAAYQRADLVICRAGATTIAEVTACGRPGIFIPFPHAVDDHQRCNAEALLKKGAGFMLLERELSGEKLAGMISELMSDPETLQRTGQTGLWPGTTGCGRDHR